MSDRRSQRDSYRLAHYNVARTVMCEATATTHEDEPSTLEVHIARKNALGLEFASRYPGAMELLVEERWKRERFMETMASTSDLLDSHGIQHIYIKNEKLYQYYDSNLDVIVRKESWKDARVLLRHQGYTPKVMFKEPDKIMFDKNGAVSIHLHPGVTWNGVPYFDIEELWQCSVESITGKWRLLGPEHDLLTNLAHNLFENYQVSLGDILYFKRFLERSDPDMRELEAIAARNGWRYGFRRAYTQVSTLIDRWAGVVYTGKADVDLLTYPYRISPMVLAPVFLQRIGNSLAKGHFRRAIREVYAYPSFYALMRRHDVPLVDRAERAVRRWLP